MTGKLKRVIIFWIFLLNYLLFDYHDFRRQCYDVCEKRKDAFICEARDSEHLGKTLLQLSFAVYLV